MWFINSIVSWLSSVRDYFYNAYLEVRSWVYPFYTLSYPLYSLYYAFYYLASYFSSFNEWVDDVANKVASILSYSNIYSYFSTYFTYAVDAYYWVRDASQNILWKIDNWWSTTSANVLSWIEDAKQWAKSLIDQVASDLTRLREAWDNFVGRIPSIDEVLLWFKDWWGSVLINLDSWWADRLLDVTGLIDTAIKNWSPVLESWQTIYALFSDFFEDPLQWFYNKLEEFFDRFW